MADFSFFSKTYGKAKKTERASVNFFRKYKAFVPEQLIEFWVKFGFGSYAQGLISVINPVHYEKQLNKWLFSEEKNSRAIPVIRTAFGNLIYWQNDKFVFFDIHYNRFVGAGSDVEVLFYFYLTDKKSRKSILEEPKFKKALKAFGELEQGEIYAYNLPLSMGGRDDLKNMGKMKVHEHLELLLSASK